MVVEYVIMVLFYFKLVLLNVEDDFILGIIGLGNVGFCLVYMVKLLGWNVIGYDFFV